MEWICSWEAGNGGGGAGVGGYGGKVTREVGAIQGLKQGMERNEIKWEYMGQIKENKV